MSSTLSTIVQPGWTARLGATLRIFNACWEGIAGYLLRRAAIATLRELDDRALEDLGLTRSQIEAAVYGFIPAPRWART
jgi:uncharacterized protein YjiS (DUF1127 family)